MADVLTRKQRSYCMSQIKGKDTQPELILRKALSHVGLRGYRLHYKLLGKPDIVFLKRKIAIFIDGCFWHRCPKCFSELSTTKKYWVKKIQSNIDRDQRVNKILKKMGWKILRIWEHDTERNLNICLLRIRRLLKKKARGE